MVKKRILILLSVAMMVLSGCAKTDYSMEMDFDDADISIEDEKEINNIDENIYIGEYLDSDVNEPNLEIAKGEDGTYIVQIGIYRLTSLDDGVGELTAEGMLFTATDAAGNPISGIITVDGETAIVTFTDSTWDLLENGSSYVYTKSSDVPSIW